MKRKTSKTVAEPEYLYLPDDCWILIIKYLNDGDDDYDYKRCLKSLSAISKQLFSITNRLRLSLIVYDRTAPFLSRLFHRFTNLTSLNLTHFHGDLDALLRQISLFPLKLTSLNLSQQPIIPEDSLRAFSQNITTLTSLICSKLPSFTSKVLFLIADCFPLLEELDLSDPYPRAIRHSDDNSFPDGIEDLSLSLSKLRKINLSGHYHLNDKAIFHLFKNGKLLEEVILSDCRQITKEGVASALGEKQTTLTYLSLPSSLTAQVIHSLVSFKGLTYIDMAHSTISDQLLTSIAMGGLPLKRIAMPSCKGYSYTGLFTLLSNSQSVQHLDISYTTFLKDSHVLELSLYLVGLVSVNLSLCPMLTYSSLFALLRKCPSLSEIIMKKIGGKIVENYDFRVYPQLKSLDMSSNSCLVDESIIMFAFIFPNLHRLELASCPKISHESIVHVLRRCRNISHLNLSFSRWKLLGMNFQVPKLKTLDLSFSNVNDETLYSISKSCRGLLQLLLNHCFECTEKGVKHVVIKCTQLREINLRDCLNVRTNVAATVLFSSPSLRKIIAPPHIHFSERERKLFLRRGCIVC